VRHATSLAFKGVKVGQVAKSRRHSREPHDLSAAWAKRRFWRAFIRKFVGHGQRSFRAEISPTPYLRPLCTKSRRWKTCDFETKSCFDAPTPISRRISNGQGAQQLRQLGDVRRNPSRLIDPLTAYKAQFCVACHIGLRPARI
jgi:hypothetical protein